MNLRPTTRTFRSFVLRALVPRAAIFAAAAAILGLGHAMALGPSVSASATAGEAVPAPSWTQADRAAYPGCMPAGDWPTGRAADHVVVHSFRDDGHLKIAFDDAWRLNHNATEADDVWVLGVCGRL